MTKLVKVLKVKAPKLAKKVAKVLDCKIISVMGFYVKNLDDNSYAQFSDSGFRWASDLKKATLFRTEKIAHIAAEDFKNKYHYKNVAVEKS
jgi:hypothetical protein